MELTLDELTHLADMALDNYGDAKRRTDQEFWLGVYSSFDFLIDHIKGEGEKTVAVPKNP